MLVTTLLLSFPLRAELGAQSQTPAALHRADASLRESERNSRELVEHANSIILRWTHEGRISFFNDFGQHFLGDTAEEIVGRRVIGTIVPRSDTVGPTWGGSWRRAGRLVALEEA